MSRLALVPMLLLCAALPVRADEFTDTLESALKAYREGDVKAADEDLSYATKLLGSQKAEALAKFLPPAPAGWTREDQAPEDEGVGMAMLGGGTTVSASYANGGAEAQITLLADSPMVTSLGAMMGGLAQLTGAKPMRIKRVEFSETDGELRGLVNNRVLVSVSGDASAEEKKTLLEAMDFEGLGDY
ncbi:hypothetical protein [Amaricoccus solimangrovi]|uniref:Uncharacterized protein n=1 Tax=Amaricoccus solimangrovi TaxID=2589815 RepID=A0A501WWW0_9RHOB|nr:hypothetical protein [Amaricoccus solimangrovi]TPE52920.1 hypothetical protein FJM51_02505 [Amaricoccus solimangrovi]